MAITNKILHRIEEKRQIRLPSILFNIETLANMDEAIETGNPFVVHKFYDNYEKYVDKTAFKLLEEELEKPRDKLYSKDRELIKKLIEFEDKDSQFFLEISGNLLYISSTLKELEEVEEKGNITENLRVSVLLYCCLNMIELFTSYIGELLKQRIEFEKKEKDYPGFLEKFKKNEHAEAGFLKSTLSKFFNLNDSFMKETMFERNKILRNKISHANLYYDSKKDMIYQSNSKEYPLSQIKGDCSYLLDFLLEIIFLMNCSSNDLTKKVDETFKSMAKTYLSFSRAGLQKKFQQVIIKMMKE